MKKKKKKKKNIYIYIYIYINSANQNTGRQRKGSHPANKHGNFDISYESLHVSLSIFQFGAKSKFNRQNSSDEIAEKIAKIHRPTA